MSKNQRDGKKITPLSLQLVDSLNCFTQQLSIIPHEFIDDFPTNISIGKTLSNQVGNYWNKKPRFCRSSYFQVSQF